MARFSKKFVSLLENMRSDFPITEKREKTSAGRDKERTENRIASAEEKFKEGQEVFNIRSFTKALKLIFTQIMGERDKVSLAISTKADGSKYGSSIARKLDSLISVTDNLINNANTRFREEGGKLEKGDEETITTWREQYNKIKSDFEAVSNEWIKAVDKQTKERPVDSDNVQIEKAIMDASKFFDKAVSLLRSKSSIFAALSVEKNQKPEDKKVDSQNIEGDLKDTILQRNQEYTGKEGEIVKEVKKLIYKKFKKYTKLSGTSDWKLVFKNPENPSTSLRANTANVIKAVKRGLTKDYPELQSDTTGSITPKFYTVLKGIKESLSSNQGKIVSFESFMRSKVNEGFDEDAAVSSIHKSNKPKSKSNNGKSKIPKYSATPFKTKEEGNKFREWVNKKYPDWAKKNNLEVSGPENNSYIRKAYSEYGSTYSESNVAPVVVKKEVKLTGLEMRSVKDWLSTYAPYTEMQLTTDKGEPVIYYRGDPKSQAKGYGHYYNNRRVSYKTSAGKLFYGTHSPENKNVKFDNGKTFASKDVFKMTISDSLSGEKASTAQSKKAYVSKSGDGYVNVRSSAEANTGYINNLIYKHTDKNSPIGIVISSTVAKSSEIGDKTWYKIQFPSKMSGREYGYVRADTVDLK